MLLHFLAFGIFLYGHFGQLTDADDRFSHWELTSGEMRFTNGRPYDGNSSLAQLVATNADAYWTKLSGAVKGYVDERSDQVMTIWNHTVAPSQVVKGRVSKQCFDVIEYMIRNPMKEEWTAKIIDSMNTFPAGMLSSTTTELGDFDQCLAVSGAFKNRHFVGKYCLATVNLPRPSLYEPINLNYSLFEPAWIGKYVQHWYSVDNKYPLATGVCFPSICSEHEVNELLMSYYQILKSFEFNVTYCQSMEEPTQPDPRIWIAIVILVIPVVLVALGFLFEVFFSKTKSTSTIGKVLHCFSPIANTRALFSITEGNSETAQFQFIHGIRAIGSVFIMCSHVVALLSPSILHVNAFARFPNDHQDMARMLFAQVAFNGGLIVHTFFVVSGMFLAYNGLSMQLKVNFTEFVLLRWLRFTPATIGMICLIISLELFGSGPLWHHNHLWLNLGGCYDYWWTHLLYINNMVPFDHQCSLQTWYLGAEMQLHVIGFTLLIAYTQSSRLTYWISFLFLPLQGIIVTVVLTSGWVRHTLMQFYAFMQYPFPQWGYNLRILYLFPFNHLVPYFTGAIIGQMLLERKIIKLSNTATRLFWSLTLFVIVFMLTHTYFIMQLPTEELQYETPTTVTLGVQIFILTLAWSLANGWIVYQCATNSQNCLSRFLSVKIFQPISRLSFSFYLVHLATMWYNVFQTRTTISLVGRHALWQLACTTLVQSFILAYFLNLTFETPAMNLLKRFVYERQAKTIGKAKRRQSLVNNSLVSDQ